MPTTLVDWTRLYRACGLRRTEEYHGRILINLQIRKKITSEIYQADRTLPEWGEERTVSH